MYLAMGWTCSICFPDFIQFLPKGAVNCLIMGGVAYTAGVPFFIRNNNLDHSIWHLFVLAGSIFHWCGVFFYIVNMELGPIIMEAEAEEVSSSSSLNDDAMLIQMSNEL